MSNTQGKLEVRLDKDQLDILIYSLNIAERHTHDDETSDKQQRLFSWLAYRRQKRWGNS